MGCRGSQSSPLQSKPFFPKPQDSESIKNSINIANYETLACCDLSCNPVFTHLAESIEAWKAIPPKVLQATFRFPAETKKLFPVQETNDVIFLPHPK
ncbi:hypothetical protein ES288_D06G228300v1 [Gossypium darwinii]|uniref:Uncharacterized protein n=2 Tax=Gossypium TaxID=3633 RepID=A0A5D2KLW4_GOSTO|nr:hypothetical protein ES288_D06G228300v1 [Gossypium darwinii]TYH68067.1 hypothetical protein ES332_D06G232400v1 [Gossypium tomentosum]